jgi:hypothetical protein
MLENKFGTLILKFDDLGTIKYTIEKKEFDQTCTIKGGTE